MYCFINILQVDIDNWHSPNFLIKEKLDIMQDYPEMYKKLHKEEYGYIKGSKYITYILICYLIYLLHKIYK